MTLLVLAHLDDRVALGVAAALRRARRQVLALTPEALAMAPGITYRQAPKPPAYELMIEWEIRLAGGKLLHSGEIEAVFNRMRSVDAPHFASSDPADREYAQAESAAWLVSWLAALEAAGARVVNPARRGGLQPGWGGWEWGLPPSISPHFKERKWGEGEPPSSPPGSGEQQWGEGEQARLLVAGEQRVWQGEPLGDLRIADFETGIRSIQARSSCVLCELRFERTVSGWQIGALEPFPLAVNQAGIATIARLLG